MLNAEGIQQIASMARDTLVTTEDGIRSTVKLFAIPIQPTPATNPLEVQTLSSLVEYVNGNRDELIPKETIIHVKSPNQVEVIDNLDDNNDRQRFLVASTGEGAFRFDEFLSAEFFRISVATAFVESDNRTNLMGLVSKIREETVTDDSDDGISQTVTARSGVASVSEVVVENPVRLQPFRTFIEIDQPESSFVVRFRGGSQVGLFQVDDDSWSREAVEAIKKYIMNGLEGEMTGALVIG